MKGSRRHGAGPVELDEQELGGVVGGHELKVDDSRDINGDGIPDIIVANGPGSGSLRNGTPDQGALKR